MIFYDTIPIHRTNNGRRIIDRVYTLSFSQFSDMHWEKLLEIYARLPEWRGASEDGCACWYGTTEVFPHLIASVEPSGLHITGELELERLDEWHAAFLPFANALPHFLV
jgi:hypothetical protein